MNILLIILLVLALGGGGYYGYGMYGGTGLGGALLLALVVVGVFWYMGFPRRGGSA